MGWRSSWAVALMFGLASASGVRAADAACVSLAEARPLVQAGTIVPLVSVLGAARRAVKGEMIDGDLCGGPGNYRYVVTFLGPDGKVIRATINAKTGEVVGVK
ncbi:PepSY domain-containing protein [Labrys miyagiensis]